MLVACDMNMNIFHRQLRPNECYCDQVHDVLHAFAFAKSRTRRTRSIIALGPVGKVADFATNAIIAQGTSIVESRFVRPINVALYL